MSATRTLDINHVEKNSEKIPDKIRYPSRTYDREVFYKTQENVRYILEFSLINGQQASDVNIGIEDLIEFAGDVEKLLDKTDNIEIHHRDHTSWTLKMNTGDNTDLDEINSKKLESSIEELADQHGISLQKTVGFAGRGYKDRGHRVMNVNYSFGSYDENPEQLINSDQYMRSKVQWVGGSIGEKEMLNESTIEMKSVKTKTGLSLWIYNILRKLNLK